MYSTLFLQILAIAVALILVTPMVILFLYPRGRLLPVKSVFVISICLYSGPHLANIIVDLIGVKSFRPSILDPVPMQGIVGGILAIVLFLLIIVLDQDLQEALHQDTKRPL